MLRRKIARSSDSSNSTPGGGPRVLTASRLVQQGLRTVLLVGMLVLIDTSMLRVFFRYQNLVNILLQVSLLGLMTIGMTVVMIAGGIDLSFTGQHGNGGGAWRHVHEVGRKLDGQLFYHMVAVGVLVGLVNGFAVSSRLKMIPFSRNPGDDDDLVWLGGLVDEFIEHLADS